MAEKAKLETPEAKDTPLNFFAQMQEAGLGKAFGMSTAWFEAMGDMSAEVMQFMAERIKEDVKTQHAMMHCKNLTELQHVQAQFIEKAINQYQAETGKLVEMGTQAISPDDPSKPS